MLGLGLGPGLGLGLGLDFGLSSGLACSGSGAAMGCGAGATAGCVYVPSSSALLPIFWAIGAWSAPTGKPIRTTDSAAALAEGATGAAAALAEGVPRAVRQASACWTRLKPLTWSARPS